VSVEYAEQQRALQRLAEDCDTFPLGLNPSWMFGSGARDAEDGEEDSRQKAIAKLRETDVFYVFPTPWAPVLGWRPLGGRRILSESALSFLGFGVATASAYVGVERSPTGWRYLREDRGFQHSWLAIMITVLGFNLFGDGPAQHPGSRGVSR